MPTKTGNKKSAWSAKDIYDMIFSTYGNAHVNATKARAKEASKYTIPYIPEKEVMLTTGRYNTGKISTNLLDSIYDAAKRTGVPLDIALGLAGRESTLGVGRGFKRGKSVSGTDLYSNWQQIQVMPHNKSEMDKWNSLLGRTDLTDEDYDFKSEFLIKAQNALENTKPLEEHPIDNALKFYQTGKYNPGDSRHSQMVEEDGKVLMSDPAIQKWLKTKNNSQMKCGGRRKAQLGLDIREGGIAIPIAPNMYYMDGRSHDEGGIGIGPNNKNGLEVEGGEVVKVGKNDVKVFSSVPLLRGASPAELVLGGANPNTVFKAQEEFKDRNRINDDGTRYEVGGDKRIYTPSKSIQRQIQETGKITIGGAPTIGGLRTYKYLRGLANARKYADKGNLMFDKLDNFITKNLQTLINKRKISANQGNAYKGVYNQIVGEGGINIPRTASLFLDNDSKEMKAGGIYIKPNKRGTFTAAAAKRGMGVQEFASKVLANKEDYSSAMVKKANFARNANRWKKELGGSSNYYSIMEKVAKDNYKRWGFNNEDEALMHALNDNTYNYRGYYNKYPNSTANADTHWTDEFKTVYHPTFSIESIYSGNKSIYNPLGLKGGYWDGDNFVPAKWQKNKKEFGGNMIYTINGNVKNGLMNTRPKAKYGKIDRKNKDVKVGPDGLIYKRAADGEWYTDGTEHITSKPIVKNSREDLILINDEAGYIWPDSDGTFLLTETIVPEQAKVISKKFDKPKRTHVSSYAFEDEEKETKKIGSLTYEKDENGQWVPAIKQSITTTRDGGRPKDFGMTRTGVNHPSDNYKYHPLTGEKVNADGIVETSEPSVKGTTKVSTQTSSTPRRGNESATSRGTAKVEYPKPATAVNPMEARYASRVQKGQAQEVTSRPVVTYNETDDKNPDKYRYTRAAGFKDGNVTASPGNNQKEKADEKDKDGRWIGQYKTTNAGDWIGLGSNVLGSLANYLLTKSAINKTPNPIKPVMAQASKLKTKYNVEPQLTELREAEQMNRAAVRRNTQSSNTSLAREQRLMNESRGARNTLYGQKENIETQLINQDRLNRQSVMKDNVRAYNEYLNRVTGTKLAQNEMRISNMNNLISGLTGSVNNILGTIETRRATNNTLRAIAAANPNVDARLIGGFDYYIDPITKKKYNKNQQYVGTING